MNKLDDNVTRMWAADSLVHFIGKLDLDRLPPNEGRALAECQGHAMEAWLAAYADLRTAPASTASPILLPALRRRGRRHTTR